MPVGSEQISPFIGLPAKKMGCRIPEPIINRRSSISYIHLYPLTSQYFDGENPLRNDYEPTSNPRPSKFSIVFLHGWLLRSSFKCLRGRFGAVMAALPTDPTMPVATLWSEPLGEFGVRCWELGEWLMSWGKPWEKQNTWGKPGDLGQCHGYFQDISISMLSCWRLIFFTNLSLVDFVGWFLAMAGCTPSWGVGLVWCVKFLCSCFLAINWKVNRFIEC